SGEILVDGIPLSRFESHSWRRGIGYVPQEFLLFHDSIRRNVTLGNDDIPDDQVKRALRSAEAWDFVSRLPGGIEHSVGERGAMLSGGQRQRIAIARALAEQPRLLILDEATTALDPETEKEICDTLVKLKHEVTILAISHQSALREVADIVYEVGNQTVRRSVMSAGASDRKVKTSTDE
ncbi:MAG: ATP-binding cassette domain-containing protein, partial [Gemmatimonadota bacterium]